MNLYLILWLVICFIIKLNGNKFDPYIDNGGTIVGLAGKDYVIIASDTRLSNQYMIQSRNISRIFKVFCT